MRWSYVLVAAVLPAAALIRCGVADSPPPPPADDGRAVVTPGTRAVHGVVVTEDGDPLPGVRFEADLGAPPDPDAPPESGAFGEFCWFVAAEAQRAVVARRNGFADATIEIPAGGQDVELLVRMRLAPVPGPGTRRRFFIVDPAYRALPGADVRVADRSTGAEVLRARSGPDGAIGWSGPRSAFDTFDLRVVTPNGAESRRSGLRLVDGGAIPVSETPAAGALLRARFVGPHAPADATDFDFLDAAQRLLLRGRVADGEVEGRVPAGERVWVHADDGSTVYLAGVGPADGFACPVDTSKECATLRIVATPELEAAAPVLVPLFGEPRIVHGLLMSDLPGGAAAEVPEIPLRRVGGVFRSPRLDVEARALAVRSTRRDDDVRVLADLRDVVRNPGRADRVVDGVRVFHGRESVSVTLSTESARTAPYFVTLARRGGPYCETRLVPAGVTTTWSGLGAGAFLLTVERAGAAADRGGAPRVQVFDDVRRVLVEPGASRALVVRCPRDDVAGVVKTSRR